MVDPRTPTHGQRLVVVSPHHDDAVLSVGATLAHLAEAGVDVRVLTVFGGDPDQERAPGASNRRAGFSTTGEAARARRREDDEACSRLGVRADRLPFDDDEDSTRDPDAVRAALEVHLAAADMVLLPGRPLVHPDHLLVARAVVTQRAAARPLGLYLEQPYATWQALSRTGGSSLLGARRSSTSAALVDVGTVDWQRSPGCPRCYVRKLGAMGAYRSQLRVLRRWPRGRIAAHELLVGGERVAWPSWPRP